MSANGEWIDDDRETETTWYLDADDEMTICMNNPDRLIGSTGSYGEYINDNVYGVSHNNSIKEILDPTMKQYDAQIVMRDIND